MNQPISIPNLYLNSAEYYDYDTRDIVSDDLPFYLEYATRCCGNGGDILELACGTGRVSITLAQNGYRVNGIDLSEAMLQRYQEKVNLLPEEVRNRLSFSKADMSDFELGRTFKLIIIPFRAFQSLTEESHQRGCLRQVRKHLQENGIFIIDVFRPYKIMDESWVYPEMIQWETVDPQTGQKIVKKHQGRKIDPARQIIYPELTYEITDSAGVVKTYTEPLELKYYYYEQLKNLLISERFTIIEEYGWYDRSCARERDIATGREMIFICQKG